jgi:hypothetical protein
MGVENWAAEWGWNDCCHEMRSINILPENMNDEQKDHTSIQDAGSRVSRRRFFFQTTAALFTAGIMSA